MFDLERLWLLYNTARSELATSPVAVACAVCLIYLVYCLEQYVQARLTWTTIPTRAFPISPISLLSNFFPLSKWNPAVYLIWTERYTLYASSEIVSVVGVLKGSATLYTGSPEVIRQILANKAPFSKPPIAKDIVAFMGVNLVASDGDTWRTHRSIVAPAFSHEGYKQVWAETTRTYQEMCAVEGWDEQPTVSLSTMSPFTKKLALFIVASCGFNIPLSWADGDTNKDGRMTLGGLLKVVASSIYVRWLTPKWMYYLPIQGLRRIDAAYNGLDSFLHRQIGVRKREIRDEIESGTDSLEAKRDIFSRLVAASVNEGKRGLTDREINGNTFILLFAGHETTAHTLAVTLILLGLYEEEQEKAYNHIVHVVGDRLPTFEDYEALEPVVAPIIYESLRLYPAVFMGFRIADEDTQLSIPRTNGLGTTELVIPKGTRLIMDLVGAGYNPRWYPDTNAFKPSRFHDRLDTSLAFSHGPRTCVGRKFAVTEMVCFVSLILRDWKVEIERNEKETREQWRERVMRPTFDIAMIMPDIPMKLIKRRSQ